MKKYARIISNILNEYNELISSPKLTENEKETLRKLQSDSVSQSDLEDSLLMLSICMEKHYGTKPILLIDEYDVPLEAAHLNGYYDDMVDFIRTLFSSVMKTNNSLEKGIMTGCLRISKESIFTGLNNFQTYCILDEIVDDCFGFTKNEVEEMLEYYHFMEHYDEMKQWYDGYRFGNQEIYNPWDVLNYVQDLLDTGKATPKTHWANSSSNDIVMEYIQNGDEDLYNDFQKLMDGETIIKYIDPQLTYREILNTNNVYSFLLFTGYLKVKNEVDRNTYELIIPNREVHSIYQDKFTEYFDAVKTVNKNTFIEALLKDDAENAALALCNILEKDISYYDNIEAFYHGFLIGFFHSLPGYRILSNRESGEGRLDICLLPKNFFGTAIIIECKHSEHENTLVKDSRQGACQILEKRYMEDPSILDYKARMGFGISFNRKQCFITSVSSIKKV